MKVIFEWKKKREETRRWKYGRKDQRDHVGKLKEGQRPARREKTEERKRGKHNRKKKARPQRRTQTKANTHTKPLVILSCPDGRGREAFKVLQRPMAINVSAVNASQKERRAAEKQRRRNEKKKQKQRRGNRGARNGANREFSLY